MKTTLHFLTTFTVFVSSFPIFASNYCKIGLFEKDCSFATREACFKSAGRYGRCAPNKVNQSVEFLRPNETGDNSVAINDARASVIAFTCMSFAKHEDDVYRLFNRALTNGRRFISWTRTEGEKARKVLHSKVPTYWSELLPFNPSEKAPFNDDLILGLLWERIKSVNYEDYYSGSKSKDFDSINKKMYKAYGCQSL